MSRRRARVAVVAFVAAVVALACPVLGTTAANANEVAGWSAAYNSGTSGDITWRTTSAHDHESYFRLLVSNDPTSFATVIDATYTNSSGLFTSDEGTGTGSTSYQFWCVQEFGTSWANVGGCNGSAVLYGSARYGGGSGGSCANAIEDFRVGVYGGRVSMTFRYRGYLDEGASGVGYDFSNATRSHALVDVAMSRSDDDIHESDDYWQIPTNPTPRYGHTASASVGMSYESQVGDTFKIDLDPDGTSSHDCIAYAIAGSSTVNIGPLSLHEDGGTETDPNGGASCGAWYHLGCYIRAALSWAFVPDSATVAGWHDRISTLEGRPPADVVVGGFSMVSDAYGSVHCTEAPTDTDHVCPGYDDGTVAPAIPGPGASVGAGNVVQAAGNVITGTGWGQTLYTLERVALWVGFALFAWWRISQSLGGRG